MRVMNFISEYMSIKLVCYMRKQLVAVVEVLRMSVLGDFHIFVVSDQGKCTVMIGWIGVFFVCFFCSAEIFKINTQ